MRDRVGHVMRSDDVERLTVKVRPVRDERERCFREPLRKSVGAAHGRRSGRDNSRRQTTGLGSSLLYIKLPTWFRVRSLDFY